ncbi:MAG: hypothetical protein NG784_11015 [Candidatus Jettenia sp.]|nr:hypothetical protein [Candidatus Jettenia sp.]
MKNPVYFEIIEEIKDIETIAIIFKIVKMRACPVGVFTELKDKIYFQQVRAAHGTVV